MQKLVGIFHPDGNYFNNPSLKSIVAAFIESGWQVDIYGRASSEFQLKVPVDGNLRLFTYSPVLPPALLYGSYSLLIGIDEGIVDAAFMSKSSDIPYGYISYEIYYDKELSSPVEKRNKRLARAACERAQFAIVQDDVRGQSLMREYGIPKEKLLYIPVSGAGVIPYEPSFYLHDKLGIGREKAIILYMGSLGAWAATDLLAEQSEKLPDKYVLVLHGRYGVQESLQNRYVGHSKVFFSTEPADDDITLSQLVRSAFCCVALYVPAYTNLTNGRNLLEIGMASGKIATALQHCVPVAVNEIGQVAQIVRNESCGVVLDLQSFSLNAVSALEAVHDIHGNCRRAFETYFDFNRVKEKFLSTVQTYAIHKDAVGGRHAPEDLEAYFCYYAGKLDLCPLLKALLRATKYCCLHIRDRYFRHAQP